MDLSQHGPSWRLRFKDPRGTTRKLRLSRTKSVARSMGRRIELLRDLARAGEPLTDELADWVYQLDDSTREKLMAWGMLTERQAHATLTLPEQVSRWSDSLVHAGGRRPHAETQKRRALAVIEAGNFRGFADIDAAVVLEVIQGWRRAGRVPGFKRKTAVSETTLANYQKALKHFTRWMVRHGYASRDPLAPLQVRVRAAQQGAELSSTAQRRALSIDEQRYLVSATVDAPNRFCMDGPDRSLLYRLALSTGLRAGALRRLTCGDVLEDGTIRARSSGAGNKRTTPKHVRGDLLADLLAFTQGWPMDEPLFSLPCESNMARMLRVDCRYGRAAWIRDGQTAGERRRRRDQVFLSGPGIDFHGLRHSFATTLIQTTTAAGRPVHPKTLMQLMDHAKIEVTMQLYSHSLPETEFAALAELPDLTPGSAGSTRRIG